MAVTHGKEEARDYSVSFLQEDLKLMSQSAMTAMRSQSVCVRSRGSEPQDRLHLEI